MNKFPEVDPRFDQVLAAQQIPPASWADYRKWVRFYLDFCDKYGHPPSDLESVPSFIAKLATKGQTVKQQAEAQQAVEYYASLLLPLPPKPVAAGRVSKLPLPPVTIASPISPSVAEVKTPAWQEVAARLQEQIMLRHYSPRTLEAYSVWIWKCCRFLEHKPPESVTTADVQRFLADLAVRQQVSAAAQNQAFHALLFLFRYVFKRDLGDLRDTPRAKTGSAMKKQAVPIGEFPF
ncbi:site-specific integrase [Anthocerotibacter panamensis]|uniref:site-specific integrase n=1 Tax=Anthocerotibacter panamensis TaxID=2857077 RepID=UPI001C402285|nr:site-specific integrase [Anthocerotibacter panamensis]